MSLVFCWTGSHTDGVRGGVRHNGSDPWSEGIRDDCGHSTRNETEGVSGQGAVPVLVDEIGSGVVATSKRFLGDLRTDHSEEERSVPDTSTERV